MNWQWTWRRSIW